MELNGIIIDLHLHSTFSDGSLTPSALANRAARRGVCIASLTDHDTTAGSGLFADACGRAGVRSLAGIELSADAPYTLHILGYAIDPENSYLQDALTRVREHREHRNVLICEALQRQGIDICPEDVAAASGGQVMGRPHFAAVLVSLGAARDWDDAFARYLGRGGSAYVPRVRLGAQECISLVAESGGVAVLAHPGQTGLDWYGLGGLLGRLRDAGLWGMECFHPSHGAGDIFEYMRIAAKMGLRPTAGSDYHCDGRPPSGMGVRVEDGFDSVSDFL